MIKFLNQSNDEPYSIFKKKYEEAIEANQPSIEAISISSFDLKNKIVNSRYVNLKFVDNDRFIFFTNYNSPKSNEFESHKQIAATFFWHAINTQIRIRANIKKTPELFNKKYFKKRSREKNALAISSNQSQPISTHDLIKEKYYNTKKTYDLTNCPEYWGGFEFTPYEIEFWEGSSFRLNKRNLYKKNETQWDHFILEP